MFKVKNAILPYEIRPLASLLEIQERLIAAWYGYLDLNFRALKFSLGIVQRFIHGFLTIVSTMLKFNRNSIKFLVSELLYLVRAITNSLLKLIKFVFYVPMKMLSTIHQIVKYFGWNMIASVQEIEKFLMSIIKFIHMDAISVLKEIIKFHADFVKSIMLENFKIVYSFPTKVFEAIFKSYMQLLSTEIISAIKESDKLFRSILTKTITFIFTFPFKFFNFLLKLPSRIRILFMFANMWLGIGKLVMANSVSSFYNLFLLLNHLTNLLQNFTSFSLSIYEMLLEFK